MADDIVNSLRSSAQWIQEMEHESWLGTAELQREAANEIERLRAAGDALVEECWSLRTADDAVKAWQEARRG